jgi:hypothetical protein
MNLADAYVIRWADSQWRPTAPKVVKSRGQASLTIALTLGTMVN